MQLGSLIKKTNKASCLLTQCLAQGISPRPYTITLLGSSTLAQKVLGKKTLIIPQWSVSPCPSHYLYLTTLYVQPRWLPPLLPFHLTK